jgi:transcriptional regulator with XRE-family HTH domain
MIKNFSKKSKKNHIKGLMAFADVSVRDIARRLNITDAAVSQVISGITTSYRVQKTIADAIGVDYEKLWGSPKHPHLCLDDKENQSKKQYQKSEKF